MKLVCLDDDRRMEATLRRFAGRLGHQVDFHTAGRSFKAEVEAEAPDLIVLDLMLGRESSIDIIAWLAQTRVRAPIVLLSGHGDELLDAARRIAQASGIEVLGAVNKGQMVRDLPPLLLQADRRARQAGPEVGAGEVPLEPGALAACIRAGAIEPWLQPIVSPIDGRLRGAEILARLRLPSGEILDASALVPLAESANLILPLAEALFAGVLALKDRLRPLRLDLVSVNLSTLALDRQPAIALVRILVMVGTLIDGLADCCRVRLELTESGEAPPLRKLGAQIARLGAALAVDDFGAGFSCVRALSELPPEMLRMDLSCVAATPDSPESRQLLLAIVALRRGLGLRLVCEGGDGGSRRRVLLESGGDRVQSDLFGGPLDIQAFAGACDALARGDAGSGPEGAVQQVD